MKNKKIIKVLLTAPISLMLILLVVKSANGKIVETIQIRRLTPPPVPTAPKKPEPTSPPTVPGLPTVRPSSGPSQSPSSDPSSTPQATPTSTPSQENGSSSEDGGTGGTDSSTSSSQGSVLGVSTMAATGGVEDAIIYSMFSLGSVLSSVGIMRNGRKDN